MGTVLPLPSKFADVKRQREYLIELTIENDLNLDPMIFWNKEF